MSQTSKLEYRLPEHLGGESLIASLATRFHLQDESRPPRSLHLLDTFDWRLYQAGWWLTLLQVGPSGSALLVPSWKEILCHPDHDLRLSQFREYKCPVP